MMTAEKMIIGEISQPRFEFRAFGRDFKEAAVLMARLSGPVPEELVERTSKEMYIISHNNEVTNTKIRDGKIDIKTFVQEVEGLEQWNPLMKGEFPMNAEMIKKEIIPALKVEMPDLEKSRFSLEEFLAIVSTHPELQVVTVEKERFGYTMNNTICEYAIVYINGVRLVTVNSESTELEDIKKTINDLGLEGIENINYVQAIKRVVGITDKAFAN